MRICFPAFLLSLLLAGPAWADEPGRTCNAAPASNLLGAQLSRLALNEYLVFNGHRIDADGHLWKFGSVESETELLHDPATGQADAGQSGRFAWRRVWEYWLTLDGHRPGVALGRKVVSVPGLIETPGSAEAATEIRLRDLLLPDTGMDAVRREALNQALIRAAINDTPWSATFISYLMHQAGLSEQQFRYSDSHWRYIQQAFAQPAAYAYRACDPKTTVPATGDLLCYGRGSAPLKSFEEWRAAVGEPDFSTPAHCELVSAVDLEAKKIEVIGGNVLQSVTRRKLKLNQENLLSKSHYRGSRLAAGDRACSADISCEHADLNQQYWGVLLQLRQGPAGAGEPSGQ